jgi:hypothetical protein
VYVDVGGLEERKADRHGAEDMSDGDAIQLLCAATITGLTANRTISGVGEREAAAEVVALCDVACT